MTKVFFRDMNFVLADVLDEFEVVEDYAQADAVVCWTDVDGECRDFILNANYLGIPTLVMQHGLRASHEYAVPYNAPLVADKIMVWGTKDKERVMLGGVTEDRIFVTGTTLLNHLTPKKPHQGINVVFLPMHWDGDLEENRVLAEKIKEIEGINVITKLIDDMDATGFENPIYSRRSSNNHLEICASILSTADIVVGMNEGTFELFAYAMDIPVIVVDLWKPKFFGNRLYFPEISSFFSTACQRTSLDDLERSIKDAITNPGIFSSERKKALFEYAGVGFDTLNPKQRIINSIRNAIDVGGGMRAQSRRAIVEQATRNLTPQLKLKDIRSQQAVGSIKKNLEEVKHANQSLVMRQSAESRKGDTALNPLDFNACLANPFRVLTTSAWNEHVPFGMFLVDLLRPSVLVELGTHIGVSYSAFCQAVRQLGLNTRCYAVDTWEGDSHAGYYGEEILAELREYHDPLYGEFSRLLQSKFDDAVKYFPENSIDLLHIDGLHDYESVKHDFEKWLPKLSQQGVVVFHDVNVRERGFGVWRLWLELKQKYPSFEFFHGHGLGILYVGNMPVPAFNNLFSMTEDQAKNFREFFFKLGSQLTINLNSETRITNLTQQNSIKDQLINSLSTQNSDLQLIMQSISSELNSRSLELNAIYSSRSWRLILRLRRVREFLLPVGSMRDRSLKFIYRAVRSPFSGLRWMITQWRILGVNIKKINEYRRFYGWRQTIKKIYVKFFSKPSERTNGLAFQEQMASLVEQPEKVRQLLLQPLRGFSMPASQKRVNLVLERFDDSSLESFTMAAVVFSSLLSKKWGCALRIITRVGVPRKSVLSEILKRAGVSAPNVEFVFVPVGNPDILLSAGQDEYFVALSLENVQSLQSDFNLAHVFYFLHEEEKLRIETQDMQPIFENLFLSSLLKMVVAGKPLYERITVDGKSESQERVIWFEQPAAIRDWPDALKSVIEKING